MRALSRRPQETNTSVKPSALRRQSRCDAGRLTIMPLLPASGHEPCLRSPHLRPSRLTLPRTLVRYGADAAPSTWIAARCSSALPGGRPSMVDMAMD